MKAIFGIFIFALAMFSFNNASLSSSIDGKALYKKGNCSSCHGKKGKSILVKYGNLQNPKLTLEQRIKTITNGSPTNPTMVAFKDSFIKEEIRAIAEYTMTFIKE